MSPFSPLAKLIAGVSLELLPLPLILTFAGAFQVGREWFYSDCL